MAKRAQKAKIAMESALLQTKATLLLAALLLEALLLAALPHHLLPHLPLPL